jgi:hypothetical protein
MTGEARIRVDRLSINRAFTSLYVLIMNAGCLLFATINIVAEENRGYSRFR